MAENVMTYFNYKTAFNKCLEEKNVSLFSKEGQE